MRERPEGVRESVEGQGAWRGLKSSQERVPRGLDFKVGWKVGGQERKQEAGQVGVGCAHCQGC